MAHRTGRTAAALAVTAGGLIGLASPAYAGINPGYQNEPRWAVRQDSNWETLTNLTMRPVYRLDGYGWRNGFCVVAGNRWDSGTFFGAAWGNIEARAFITMDGPGGRCTVPVRAAYLHVDTSPIYRDPAGRFDWRRGCRAGTFQWNTYSTVAWKGSWVCTAPTHSGPGSNYLSGGYSANVIVDGQAFPDQPSSRFQVQWNNWPANRY